VNHFQSVVNAAPLISKIKLNVPDFLNFSFFNDFLIASCGRCTCEACRSQGRTQTEKRTTMQRPAMGLGDQGLPWFVQASGAGVSSASGVEASHHLSEQ